MKKVKQIGNGVIGVKSGRSLLCAYNQELVCSIECVACEVNKTQNIKTISCLRGPFVFGEIKE